jgi:hypothetical protein
MLVLTIILLVFCQLYAPYTFIHTQKITIEKYYDSQVAIEWMLWYGRNYFPLLLRRLRCLVCVDPQDSFGEASKTFGSILA